MSRVNFGRILSIFAYNVVIPRDKILLYIGFLLYLLRRVSCCYQVIPLLPDVTRCDQPCFALHFLELLYITDLEKTTSNDGWTDINPIDFYDNDDGPTLRSIQLGLIKINLTNPEQAIPGLRTSP